jgi:hypothetical protein
MSIDITRLSEREQVELLKLAELQYAARSPFDTQWDFLAQAVFTRDEAAGEVKQFPSGDDFAYLKYLTEQRVLHRVRAYEKSRRMMITWWLVALYLYELMTQPNELAAVASDKLGKSAYLLGQDRMQFIYSHIPADVWPNKPEVVFEGKEGMGWKIAQCPANGSAIMAMASGESQMQQYTFSQVLMDEFPRWKQQEECWRNIQPTIQGGGRCDIVCTAELGVFAYDLLYDEVE